MSQTPIYDSVCEDLQYWPHRPRPQAADEPVGNVVREEGE